MNIPGVEVLYTSKYLYDTTWGWSPMCIIWIIFIILGIVGIFVGCSDRDAQIIFVSSLIICGCTILALIFLSNGKNIYGTEYYVRINNDVTFSEITSQYTVKDIKGQMCVLRPNNFIAWEEETN